MSTGVLPWQTRLAQMDHTKGTSNKMIQDAMHQEIKDLRKLLKPETVAWRKAQLERVRRTTAEDALRVELSTVRSRAGRYRRALAQARAEREAWRVQAVKYQKQIIGGLK